MECPLDGSRNTKIKNIVAPSVSSGFAGLALLINIPTGTVCEEVRVAGVHVCLDTAHGNHGYGDVFKINRITIERISSSESENLLDIILLKITRIWFILKVV